LLNQRQMTKINFQKIIKNNGYQIDTQEDMIKKHITNMEDEQDETTRQKEIN